MPLSGRLASPIPSELLRLRLVFARLGISQKQTLVGATITDDSPPNGTYIVFRSCFLKRKPFCQFLKKISIKTKKSIKFAVQKGLLQNFEESKLYP
jgi:hypothetical protein